MAGVGDGVLAGLLVFATAVWVGGFVAIAVVAQVARRTLDRPEQIAFFRALGRVYGRVGGTALLLALGTGAALLRDRPWGAVMITAAAVAAALVVVTAVGVVQARRMTRLRRSALHDGAGPTPDHVREAARRAAVLRSAIGVLSVVLLALGVTLAT